jgi:23S rRNA pseudouridine2605 synthase
MAQERLQKILARAGIASRRAAEEIVLAGRVRVNGKVVDELGAKANPMDDKVELDGRRILAETPTYIVFHKPRGIVTTLSDPEGRPTVADYIEDLPARVFPVGRLDFATSGVLLLTNDGDFSNGLLHPKKAVPKTYVVKAQGEMGDADIDRWRKGVKLEDGTVTRPADMAVLRHEGDKTWFELTISEGKNQQIRRMGEATGFRVMRLARLSFANITAEGLRPGMWRLITREELTAMKKEWGVPKRMPSSDALSRMAVKATTMKVAKAFEKGGSVEGGLSLHRKRPATVAEKLAFAGDDGPRGGRTAERGRGRNAGRVDQGDEAGFAADRAPRGTRGRRDERATEAPARGASGEKPAARGTRGRRDERAAEAPARGAFGEKPAARGTRGRRDERAAEAPRGRGGREGAGREVTKEKPAREAPARRGAGRTERAPERAVEPRRSPRRR